MVVHGAYPGRAQVYAIVDCVKDLSMLLETACLATHEPDQAHAGPPAGGDPFATTGSGQAPFTYPL